MGRVIGDTANAHGKMFAASRPDDERARIIAPPHERLTPRTITDPGELEAELLRAREQGVAFDIEERNLGTCAVAAPVRDQMGRVIGSVGLVVPTGPFRARGTDGVRGCGQGHRGALSAFLGYAGVRAGRS